MKRIMIPTVLAMLCTACSDTRSANGSDLRASNVIMRVFIDPDTGCQYLGMYGEAVTRRIAADGKTHMGCKEVQK